MTQTRTTETTVRGISLKLVAYTRALELCARMNREVEVLDFIDQIQPGEILYDLGACEGRFALYAALRQVRCYAFEPEALNFKAMLENIELNGEIAKQNLFAFQYAVGEKNHQTCLKIGQPWAGGHHRVIASAPSRSDLNFNFTSEQEVTVISLDDLIESKNLPIPDYLKVDIDGSEIPFLKGATRVLQQKKLKGIIFELYQHDDSYCEIITFLQSCGFDAGQSYEVEPNLFNIVFQRNPEFILE